MNDRRSPDSSDERVAEADRPAAAADRALVLRLLARDEAAFVSLVRAHQESLVRLALSFVGNRATAEEVVQETWSQVLAGLAGFEGRSSLRTWIFRICTNRALRRGERESRSMPLSALSSDDAPEVEPGRFDGAGHWTDPPRPWDARNPEEVLQRAQALECIERAMQALPPAQRAVVLLRDVEGLEAAEACSVLEVSESNQRVLLHRGRARIRRELEKLFSESRRC